MENKILLIIGAGFSLPANIPIQDAIIDKMIEKTELRDFMTDPILIKDKSAKFLNCYISVVLFLLKEFYNENVEKLESEYKKIVQSQLWNDEETYENLLPLKEKVRLSFATKVELNVKVSLEDVFTLLDKTINNNSKIGSYYFFELVNIKNSLLLLFIYYFDFATENFNDYLEKYESFIKFIVNNKNNVSIITTNWDILLERYLHMYGINLDYGFNRPYYLHDNKKISKNLSFIKIHGSTNWFSCISCNLVMNLDFEKNENFIYNNSVAEKCSSCHMSAGLKEIQLHPEIITPTMMKSFNSQLFINIWKSAYDELITANKIIFIGYSLPMADFDFRYLLKKGTNNNAKIDVILWKTDNPKAYNNNKSIISLLPETRYKSLFIGKDVKFYYDGFTKYFDNLK